MNKRLAIVCVSIIMSVAVAILAEEAATRIVVPEKLMEAIEKEHAGFKYFRPATDAVQVADARIPTEVKEGAEGWMKKVVREEWLPDNPQELMKGMTWTVDFIPPQKVDYLVMEYPKEKAKFRIIEGAGSVTILWNDPNIGPGTDAAKAAKECANRLLKLPDNKADELAVKSLSKIGGDDEMVFKGYLGIPPAEKGAWPIWYNHLTVWIAPGFFYISVPESTGVRPEKLTPRIGGYRPRFAH